MTENSPEWRIGLADMIGMAEDVNEFVTTFDQILSRIAFDGAGSDLLLQYFLDRDVKARLARVRAVIFDALEAELGEEAADRIGERGYRHFSSEGSSDV
ncbi:hypothetical protein [Micromonospora sp. KLBMP9576]|uniref:hypothetical protein n=1 Tax=Micromonospora sp. KLBMP9576 TaxID=3424769 RepID=UPI003D8A99F4